jgi:PAS domain S-box-containing protein
MLLDIEIVRYFQHQPVLRSHRPTYWRQGHADADTGGGSVPKYRGRSPQSGASFCHDEYRERTIMENELGSVVDALPGLVWTALPDGDIDFINQRWCEYTGLSVEQAYGRGWCASIHPGDLPGLLQLWQSMLASHEPREMEVRLRRFDGAYRWFRIRASPLTDVSGRVVKWCGLNTDIEDRRNADEVLHAQERRFGLIVDGLPTLVLGMTPGGEIVHANRNFLEYFGVTLQEVQSRGKFYCDHPDDFLRVTTAWSKALETGQPYDVEGRRRRFDGVYRWFHTRAFALRDTEGRIVFWYSLSSDIDDQKRAEALLAGEKRLLEMVASGHPMSRILDTLCQLVESTSSGCYCRFVLVDAAGTRFAHEAAPSLPASFISSIRGRLVNLDSDPCARAVYLNQQIVAADLTSETRWPEWCLVAVAHGLRSCWSTPISSTAGKVLGAFSIFCEEPRTPTSLDQKLIEQVKHIASVAIERTQCDAALKRSEAFLAETRQLSLTGGFFKRMATGEITWSAEVYRIFGFGPTVPVTHELIRSRVHPEDIPAFEEILEREQQGSDYEYEYRLLMPDRSIKYLHVVAHATKDRDGQLEYIAAVQDVTQRRLSEEALSKVRSELARVARVSSLGALTASIAHEVNQPLSGIITNASTCLRMLAAEPPNIDGARETARRTIRDGNRASDVITRLRALFSNKDATTEAMDLNEISSEVIALSVSELQRSRAILRQDFADDLPLVIADRVQIQQVILNLLLNASDAMSSVDDRPRHMVIKTERDENDHVRLSVQDAGVGFKSQDADRLFEAFYTTKSGGMGIGLSVSRSIIESHQGRLWASPNKGPGATFFFAIPCRRDLVVGTHSPSPVWAPGVTDAQHAMRNP